MALISCPDCGTQVSDMAVACPKCARPIAGTALVTVKTPAPSSVPPANPDVFAPVSNVAPSAPPRPDGTYVGSQLVAGEIILYRAKLSLWAVSGQIFFGILLLVIGIGLFLLIYVWIRSTTTELAVTNRRIIAKRGFISRHTIELSLRKVEAIRVEQTIMGRILGFGSIYATGTGGAIDGIHDIADPMNFRRAALMAVDDYGRG